MKKAKITALALTASLILGSMAGCNSAKESDTTSGSSDTQVTESSETLPKITSETGTEVIVESSDDSATVVAVESSSDTSADNNSSSGSSNDPKPEDVDDTKIVLDADRQQYANTFISNFAEIFFMDFSRGTATIDRYLDFVHIHTKVNSYSSLGNEKKGDLTFETFTVDTATSTVGKYFGIALSESEIKGLEAPPSTFGDHYSGPYYEDGKIWYEAGAGESYNLIGIVDSAENNGDGTITLKFTIYSIDLDTYSGLDSNGFKAYYKLTPDKASQDKTLTKVKTGRATVDVGQSGGYYLISYETK